MFCDYKELNAKKSVWLLETGKSLAQLTFLVGGETSRNHDFSTQQSQESSSLKIFLLLLLLRNRNTN